MLIPEERLLICLRTFLMKEVTDVQFGDRYCILRRQLIFTEVIIQSGWNITISGLFPIFLFPHWYCLFLFRILKTFSVKTSM
jgi:hypothetical protein